MNASQEIKRQNHRVLAGLAAIALAGAVLATPSDATATQGLNSGGSSSGTVAFDIAAYVDGLKVARAQHLIDNPALLR